MTEDERIKRLVEAAPRPDRDMITKLALLLSGVCDRPDEQAEEPGECAA